MKVQVILACRENPVDVPEGVEVVAYPSAGRGDRYDAAARIATGELLAFVDSQVTVSPGWIKEVLRLFEDQTLVVAGGPVVPVGEQRAQRISALVMRHYLRGRPVTHNIRPTVAREVREVGVSNLVIRAYAFQAVGGFQAPAGGNGESARICYKVRTLLGGKIMSEPSLALSGPAPGFPGPLYRDIAIFGRSRGGLARRLPEAAPPWPYALPSLVAALICVGIGLLCVPGAPATMRTAVAASVGFLLLLLAVPSLGALRGPGSLSDRLLAAAALPVVLLVYGVTFVRGYLGPSTEDVSPSRERTARMRVLILNWRDVTHPSGGGAEAFMHQIARRWAEEGMDVGWVTQRHGHSPRVEVIDRIRFHRVGGRVTQYPFAALAYLIRMRGRYDVLVDCCNGVPFFTPLYSRVPKVLLVHHVHQETFRAQLAPPFRWLAMWLEGSLMPRIYRNTGVVTVSEGSRHDLVELGFNPDHITVVKSGVVIPKTVSEPSPQPTVLCMGRLMPMKAVDVLIRAVPSMAAQIPNVRVEIVGQGPDRRRLERLAWSLGLARHVRFHGWVTSEVRDQLADLAWLAVCPSLFEGWGMVCMEASARGLPVVASNAPGLRESVVHGETGILFPCRDHDALSEAVVELLDNPEKLERMGEAGRRWAELHTWEGAAANFGSVLVSQVEPRREPVESFQVPSFASWG
jgi:glycosyltransferase involved in cell wall biosynthesis